MGLNDFERDTDDKYNEICDVAFYASLFYTTSQVKIQEALAAGRIKDFYLAPVCIIASDKSTVYDVSVCTERY